MDTFYRSKSIKATALNFRIILDKAHIYMKLNVFNFNNVYLSIRISSSMHLVIFVAPIFHFKRSFPLAFYDCIMMDWS